MARQLLVTEKQVRFAREFLRAINGNQNNGYLLLAVIAWLKLDKDVRHFFGFSDYKAGARALARVLLFNPNAKKKGYRTIVAALRGSRKDQRDENGKLIAGSGAALQARDFLAALAVSRFSKSHYGSIDGNEATNRLIKKWVHLTTGKALPDQWFIDTITVKRPPKQKKEPPRQPRATLNVMPRPEYLQPYAARSFYEDRPHEAEYILPQERW